MAGRVDKSAVEPSDHLRRRLASLQHINSSAKTMYSHCGKKPQPLDSKFWSLNHQTHVEAWIGNTSFLPNSSSGFIHVSVSKSKHVAEPAAILEITRTPVIATSVSRCLESQSEELNWEQYTVGGLQNPRIIFQQLALKQSWWAVTWTYRQWNVQLTWIQSFSDLWAPNMEVECGWIWAE